MKQVKIIFTAMLVMFSCSLMAQTLDEAGEAFNEAIRHTKEKNYQEALRSYKTAITIADQLGEEGVDLKIKAKTQLANTFFKMGLKAYKAKEPDKAISHFKTSHEFASEVRDEVAMEKANKYLNYVYTYKGNLALKDKDYNTADELFTEANKYKPDNPKTYYGMTIAYMKQGEEEKMRDAVMNAILYGEEESKTVAKAKDVAAKYYLATTVKALQGKNYPEAVRLIHESFAFESEDPSAYYYLTLAYNGMGEYEKAVETATTGLKLEEEKPSNFYFLRGQAYEKMGEKRKACDNYKKVTGGDYVDAATYQRETILDCK